MAIQVVRAIVGGMVIQFGTKFKMSAGFFDHGIINRKKNRLFLQRAGNSPNSLRDSNIIPGRVVIGVRFKSMVKRIKGSIGEPGNHMAVGEAYGTKNVQSQDGNDQKEQISGSWSGSIGKIILKI